MTVMIKRFSASRLSRSGLHTSYVTTGSIAGGKAQTVQNRAPKYAKAAASSALQNILTLSEEAG